MYSNKSLQNNDPKTFIYVGLKLVSINAERLQKKEENMSQKNNYIDLNKEYSGLKRALRRYESLVRYAVRLDKKMTQLDTEIFEQDKKDMKALIKKHMPRYV